MGVYIYTLRSTTRARKTTAGTVYAYRYSERFDYRSEAQRSRENLHRARWADHEGPVLVSIDGEIGSEVFRQDTPDAVWSDCDPITGEFVGYLAKKGRKWVVESLETTLLKDRLFLREYISSNALWDTVPSSFACGLGGQVDMYQKVAYAHFRAPYTKDGCFHVPQSGTPEHAVWQRMESAGYHARRFIRKTEAAA